MEKRLTLWLLAPLLFSAGCATVPAPAERRNHAQALAAPRGWVMQAIPASPFPLAAFMPPAITQAARLTIYLEGDGMAWTGPARASADPTPIDPLALRLALAQPGGAAAYVGRPCQYVFAADTCEESLWTSRRFAPEVVSATSQAIDMLKARFGALQITLVGYSGGAAVAMLVAARRPDVVRVVSVAGNLDHRAWTKLHRLDPLTGSLNPADEAPLSRQLTQWHFAGAQDDVVPPRLALDFAARHADARPSVQVMAGFDHRCCWVDAWPRLWKQVTSQP